MLSSVPDTNYVRGNWQLYLDEVAVYAASCAGMNWLDRARAIADFKRQRIRQYLGPRHRSCPREPKTFTPAFLVQLASRNKQERRAREPYFQRIADLYQDIAKLEMEIDLKNGNV